MNGYSVEEAAEVLGIPQGRVWELIARGVLAGGAEGGASMRVYLKGSTPTPTVAGTESDETSHANGNGNGANHGELSPFRELLTEFRNLTERYGQALLALGEARGEVASLRSRVDLLEARMDMRLPMRAASTVAWDLPDRRAQPGAASAEPAESPEPAESVEPEASVEPAAFEEPAPFEEPMPFEEPAAYAPATPPSPEPESIPAEVPSDTVARSPRRYGTREALAGLAEALARAEDPTLSSLPGADEAGEALAALQQQIDATAPPPTWTSEVVEPMPDELASPAFASREAATEEDIGMNAEFDDLAALAPPIEQAEEEVVQATTESFALPADQFAAAEAEPPSSDELVGADAMPAENVAPEALGATGEAAPASEESPASPYTTDVIEPDWFADGDFAWLESPTPEPAATTAPEPASAPEPEPVESGAGTTENFVDDSPAAEAGDEPRPSALEVEPWPIASEESATDEIQEEIQEAFDDLGPTRAEAIPIQTDERDPAPRADEPPSIEPHGDAGPPTSNFGLYRGQPEGPNEPAGGAPQVTAVRDEEAVMWLGDELEAGELELETPGWRDGGAVPLPTPAEPAPLQLSDAEIEQLASSEGWDDEEVSAIRGLLGRPEPGLELETPSRHEPAAPVGDEMSADRQAFQIGEPPASTSPQHRPVPIHQQDAEPRPADWLQGRRGPAASAYRRLRRIFQG